MLHADQALSQEQAVAFCKAQHGAVAGLPSAVAAVMAAAQQMVQEAQVGRLCGLC